MFKKKFYDKYWNFDNKDFIRLLEESRKNYYQKSKKKWWSGPVQINLFQGASKKEVWQFVNKLSIFVNSWIDIKWALGILIKQIKNPYLKDIVEELRDNIDHWIALNETMLSYPKIFDNLTVSLIKVWENTWKLWVILDQLDETMLESIELKWKVKWAMVYPMILMILTILMVTFMMIFIVPRVSETFTKTWNALPAPTQVVVNISNFLTHDYMIILWVMFWIYLLMKMISSTYYWKMMFAIIATKLPIFWLIVRQSNIIYFIKSFTILLDSWVLLLESLKTASQVVPNLAYKKELIRIKNEVEIWLTISKSLWLNLDYEANIYMNKLFAEEFAYVVSTWEETWSLSVSLKKIWTNYNKELQRYIWNLSSMMEPIIIVIVWILVWSIIISVMMPFFEMGKVAKNM